MIVYLFFILAVTAYDVSAGFIPSLDNEVDTHEAYNVSAGLIPSLDDEIDNHEVYDNHEFTEKVNEPGSKSIFAYIYRIIFINISIQIVIHYLF